VRTSTLTALPTSPMSVGYFTSASTTVESQRIARSRIRRSLVAILISERLSSFTASEPRRLVSLRTVDSSGTSSWRGMPQN